MIKDKLFTIFCFTLLTAVIFSLLPSCKKDSGSPAGSSHTGLVTPVGTAEGDAQTKTIGAGGGTFTTADGRLTIDIPAGALSTDMAISVQIVSNTNPAGIGKTYRLTPHGRQFSKPVKITFAYDDSAILNTVPEALGICYQDSTGVWKEVGGVQLDSTNKRLSVYTNHFSDWNYFEKLEIIPYVAYVGLNESVTLKVETVSPEDLFVPIPGTESALVEKHDISPKVVQEWRLAGAGTLQGNGNSAVYKAPGTQPAVNPVAVSAKLNFGIPNYEQLWLVSNIYVGEGITFRINNGSWLHADCALGAKTVVTSQGTFTMLQGGVIINNQPSGAVGLILPAVLSNEGGFQSWGKVVPSFSYVPQDNLQYYHYYLTPAINLSPGGVNLKLLDINYVTGTFKMTDAGKLVTSSRGAVWAGGQVIEGFFKVKKSS